MEKIVRSYRIVVLLLLLISLSASRAATISWTNAAGGNWSTAANWSPNQIPGAGDHALITNAGTYSVTVSANTTVTELMLGENGSAGVRTLLIPSGTLTVTNTTARTNGVIGITGGTLLTAGAFTSAGAVYESAASSSWRLLVPGAVNTHNLTNGELRGATLTVTNFNWVGGNIYADANGDKTIIAPGGTFNLIGDATRYLSYYAGGFGRGLDNHGTWNWTGNSVLFAYPTTVNNHGTVNVIGQGAPATYAQFTYVHPAALPTWNNFGTITKSVGTNIFYFGACNLNNAGMINAQSGTLSLYNGGAVTNTGSIAVGTNAVLQNELGTSTTLAAGSSLTALAGNSIRVISGTVFVQTTNIVAPSVWINGGTLWHFTNNVIPSINQSAGTWRLSVATAINTYNLTNGELRGGTLTVTNLNWINGNMNADVNGDKTIIPPDGILNFTGNATRSLSFYSTRGRDLDNHGTWNWTGDSVLYGVGAAVVNNYGTVIQTGGASSAQFSYYPGYASPTWNNFGTFTKSAGPGQFYFQAVHLNNTGTLNAQAGLFSWYASVVNNNGPMNVQNAGFQSYNSTATNTAAITLDANSTFTMDSGGTFVFEPASSLVSPTANAVRVNAGTVMLRSTNIVTPSAWIAGGTLWHFTNNVIPTINQSAGAWRLSVATAINTYNLTNGELRGGTLTVTNLNWINGNMNADVNGDKTIIPPDGILNFTGNATRSLSFYSTRGRDLDNHGTWNWTGDSLLYGVGAAVVNNYGTVNISGGTSSAQFLYYPGYAAPTWHNHGTITKSGSPTTFYFQGAYVNNAGAINAQSGVLSFYGSTVTNLTSGTITLAPGAELGNENGNTLALQPGSILSGAAPNAFRIVSGAVYVRSTDVTLPSLWLSGGTLYQETNSVVPVNQSGGTWRLNVPVTATTYNLTNGELRGANLTVDNFNWFGGQMNSDGPGNDLVTVNTALNVSGNASKVLSYYVAPGRSIVNNGTGVWGGVGITGQGGSTLRNNGTLTVTNDVALVWGGSGAGTVLHNTGTFTKSGGSGQSYFSSTTITNSGTFNFQSGTIRFGDFVQTAGSAFLNTNFISDAGLRVQAGTVTGGGSVAGAINSSGTLNPGASPGLITGNTFTGAGGSALNIELGGTTGAGTNYDQVRLTGAANLNGALNVSLANGFAPAISNSFTVMTFASRAGTFPTILPPPGVTLDATYTSTNLVLTVTALTNVPLQISQFPSNQTVFQTDPVTFSVGVSGVTPITYQWQFNSNNIPNATNSSYTISSTSLADAGSYQVLIADNAGATTNASATLAVIPFDGTIQWTNAAGGNWSVASNWNPNRVPGPTNTGAITLSGTYTVSINAPAAVSNLVVGSITGTQTVNLASSQTLTLGRNASFATNTVFGFDGTLQTCGGSNYFGGLVNWYTGTLTGPGRSVVGTNGNLFFISGLVQKYIVTNTVENYGQFTYSGDSGFGPGALPNFSGGAHLTNHLGGIINMGANALTYSGASTPRSYLVNFGKIVAATTTVWNPSTIGIDFLNYGLLENYSYCYIFRGQNFGTMWGYNGLTEISIFGDPTSGEYFSFEPSTVLSGVGPNIACGGLVQWNAPNTVHAGSLGIGQGSGGATFANAEFKIIANYTNTAALHIRRGALTITNPAIITDLRSYSDSFVSFWSFGVTNAGTMYINSLSHTIHSIGNGGTIVVRSNLSLAGGHTYGTGRTVITNGATGTFSGGSVDAQLIENYGTNSVTGGMSFSGNTLYRNRPGAQTYFGGGSFGGGPAAMLNEGLMNGFGGVSIPLTNRLTVLADDSLNRTLGLGNYVQELGLTESGPGAMSGTLDILGGVFRGTNSITGSLRNAATASPGKPFGLLSVTGNYTNQAAGQQTLVIAGTNPITQFPRVSVGGTAYLGGTLSVAFTNGFTPSPGNLFTVMVFSARSGVFDNIVNPTYQLEAFYTSTTLVLRAENLLPNVNLTIVGGNTQLVCNPFKLTASANDLDGVLTNLTVFMNGNPLVSNGNGGLLNPQLESDFPTPIVFTARALDDRGGTRWATQTAQLVTYPLHTLMLGGVRSNGFKICMLGETGSNYLAFATTNLNQPFSNWVNLGLMEQTNGIWRYFDAGTLTNRAQRFYRARQH